MAIVAAAEAPTGGAIAIIPRPTVDRDQDHALPVHDRARPIITTAVVVVEVVAASGAAAEEANTTKTEALPIIASKWTAISSQIQIASQFSIVGYGMPVQTENSIYGTILCLHPMQNFMLDVTIREEL